MFAMSNIVHISTLLAPDVRWEFVIFFFCKAATISGKRKKVQFIVQQCNENLFKS
jgi:hypothetical protein